MLWYIIVKFWKKFWNCWSSADAILTETLAVHGFTFVTKVVHYGIEWAHNVYMVLDITSRHLTHT